MAIRFLESFGHYSGANVAEKWPLINAPLYGDIGANFQMQSSGSTWNDTYCAVRNNASGLYQANGSIRRDFSGSTDSQWTVGFQFRPVSSGDWVLRLLSAGATQWGFSVSGGQVNLYKGATLMGTASLVMGTTTWYMIELQVLLSASAGSYELRINGTTYLSGSGNTRGVANDVFDGIMLGNASSGGGPNVGTGYQWDISDLYILNGTGNAPTSWIGDARVKSLLPNGTGTPGDAQSFARTGSGLTANYQAVDEALANQDTDYVHSSTVGQRDLYTYSDLPAGASTVYGVQAIPEARKDDAGTRTLGITMRSGGSEADLATTLNLTGSYQMLPFVAEHNPVTSAAFSASEINALESGPKVVA